MIFIHKIIILNKVSMVAHRLRITGVEVFEEVIVKLVILFPRFCLSLIHLFQGNVSQQPNLSICNTKPV